MKASKAIAGFAGQIQNQITLSLMKARVDRKIEAFVAPSRGALPDGAAARWLLVGGLVIAVLAFGALSSRTSQPVMLTFVSVLAACGLFFLLALTSGRIAIVGRGLTGLQDPIVDAWPEAGLVTTRLGRTVYANPAFGRLVPVGGDGGLGALEIWFSSEPAASEALFRLVRAAERGETRTEDVAVQVGATSVRGGGRRVVRVMVSPMETKRIEGVSLVLWRLLDVTAEHEVAKREAGAAQSRFGAYNAAPVGLLAVRADGSVSHMNDTLSAMLGVSAACLLEDGLQLETLFSPTGAEVLRRHAGRSQSSGFQCALDLITPTGRRLPVRVFAACAPPANEAQPEDRIFVVMRNVWADTPTALGEAADPNFARHFESAPFGIATVTTTGLIARANPAFQQMVLGEAGGQEDRALEVLCRDAAVERRANVEQVLADALAGQVGLAPVDFSVGAKGEYGRRIYVTPLLPSPGSREAAIVYVVDTTEQKALEAKFAHSQRLEAAGNTVGGIAHDFNNVLTAIIGSADLMLQTHRASDAAHKDIQNIKQSAARAAGLVANLMAFSRQQTLKPVVVQLGDLVTDLRPLLKTTLGEKIELQITTGRDLWFVKADRTQIDQVLVNFAVNALHAMPNGGRFAVRTCNITEREAQKLQYPGFKVAEYVMIEVEDTGTGMPPHVLANIFEPFFTTKDVGKGTGLGLATVYGIVKQSFGYIFPESTEGRGTIFRVYLPRVHVENEQEFVAPKNVKKDITQADLTGTATVLIVEDEDMVRSVAVRSLTRFGYTVLEACNGLEALDVLAGHEGRIDIVVSDVVMPEMDGPAFLKEVRKTHPDLKIIFVSGHTNEAFRASVDENETFAFLPKPFSLPQLAAKVKEELAG